MAKNKVLIVEDSKPILQIHTHLVKSVGLEPVTAETLAEVKQFEGTFDQFFCAIVDYSLPDAHNGEAIPYLLKNKVPSIVMTGMIDDETRDNILAQPVIDYITKESKQAFSYLRHLLEKLLVNHTIKILVVDDSKQARNYLYKMLRRHNYDVLQANCGEEALKLINEYKDIKLVLTDKDMPNMDGLELCNAIRAKYSKSEMAIIAVSAAENPSLTAKFIKNGANDFLKKPFCLEEFYSRVLQNVEYIESFETIQKQAYTDFMTGLYNRRYFFENVQPKVKRNTEQQIPSNIALMDIDFFKSINDQYGHEAGDEVLKHTAEIMQKYFAKDAIAARIGGEEFCIYFEDNDAEAAKQKLESFREEFHLSPITYNDIVINSSISIGFYSYIEPSLDVLINEADEFLYKAKQQGRNRLVSG